MFVPSPCNLYRQGKAKRDGFCSVSLQGMALNLSVLKPSSAYEKHLVEVS